MEDDKVKKFELNADYYVTRAVNHEMEGNMLAALADMKRALALSDDVYLRLKCANYYEQMELYEQANNIYFKLLAEKGDIMHCYYALSDNMFSLLDETAGIHYLDKYTKLAQTRESKEEAAALVLEHMDDLRRKNFSVVPGWAESPHSEIMHRAAQALERNRMEEAVELLRTVPEGSIDFVTARNNEAACLALMDRPDDALKASLRVLEVDEDNIQALYNMVKAYNAKGQRTKAEQSLSRLTQLEITDAEDLKRLGQALADCEKDAEAAEAFDKYLELRPYDPEVIHLSGIAYYNMGQHGKSASRFEDAGTLTDMYFIEKYYRNLAISRRDGEGKTPDRLVYQFQVPTGEVETRLTRLKTYINRMNENNCVETWADDRFVEILSWAFSVGDPQLNYYMIRDLSVYDCKRKDKYFDDLLLNGMMDSAVKRHLLYYIGVTGGRAKVNIVIHNILKEIRLFRDLDETPILFRAAYGMAVATLSVCTTKFERGLAKSLNVLSNRYFMMAREFKKTNALAATLVYYAGMGGDFENPKYLSELFGCSRETLASYIRALGPDDEEE